MEEILAALESQLATMRQGQASPCNPSNPATPTPSPTPAPSSAPTSSSSSEPVVERRLVSSLFTCTVCFEAPPNRYLSCPHCSTYIGCYDCLFPRCRRCPLCRRDLPQSPPPVPQLIPGVEDILPIPPIVDAIADDQLNEDVDTDLDDTVPLPPPNSP